MATIKVLHPGFLTTLQDLGRFHYAHLGISASGAADALSLRIGNLLVGNSENAAAIEMTLVGGTFEFESDHLIAVTGSDFEPTVGGEPISRWRSILVKAGNQIKFGATRSGARCYLSVQGGIQSLPTFGSVSTHLVTGLGGLEGRALKKEDSLQCNPTGPRALPVMKQLPQHIIALLEDRTTLRVTPGPQADFFSSEAHSVFASSSYTLSEDSNRMGLRLIGASLTRTIQNEMLTEGVSLGSIQIPPSGQPIILFVEHQTTGGYPKIANVISADFHRLGQLRPRDMIHFEPVSFKEAHRFLQQQEKLISSESLITA